MYAARFRLYEEYAELTISEEGFSIEETVRAIQKSLKQIGTVKQVLDKGEI